MFFDVIISGGDIVDGSNKPAFKSAIGIKGDRIISIGDLADVEAREKIDAAGLTVAPGFIDIHTHSDFTLLINGAAESQVHQGVTSEVIGNCGSSCAPLDDSASAKSSFPHYLPGLEINWKTFGEYLARLKNKNSG